jgi:hypothetical protein
MTFQFDGSGEARQQPPLQQSREAIERVLRRVVAPG